MSRLTQSFRRHVMASSPVLSVRVVSFMAVVVKLKAELEKVQR